MIHIHWFKETEWERLGGMPYEAYKSGFCTKPKICRCGLIKYKCGETGK